MRKNIFQGFVLAVALLAFMAGIASADQGVLHFAITSAVASDPSYTNYRELINYIAGRVGKKAVFISGLSYSRVDNLFVEREADVGFLCNTHFARRKKDVKFEAIAAPIIAGYGKPKFQIYVIVPKDSGIKTINDLRGKSVDLADPLSTTTVFAAYMLQKRKETIRSFFGKTIYSGSHDMTVRLVADRVVDAGFIDGHIWDYHDKVDPVYSSKTKIIYRSPDFTTPPVVVGKTTDEAVKTKITNVLLTMHEDGKGKEILKKLRIEKFVAIKDNDYDDVLKIYSQVKDRL